MISFFAISICCHTPNIKKVVVNRHPSKLANQPLSEYRLFRQDVMIAAGSNGCLFCFLLELESALFHHYSQSVLALQPLTCPKTSKPDTRIGSGVRYLLQLSEVDVKQEGQIGRMPSARNFVDHNIILFLILTFLLMLCRSASRQQCRIIK